MNSPQECHSQLGLKQAGIQYLRQQSVVCELMLTQLE